MLIYLGSRLRINVIPIIISIPVSSRLRPKSPRTLTRTPPLAQTRRDCISQHPKLPDFNELCSRFPRAQCVGWLARDSMRRRAHADVLRCDAYSE